MRLFGTIFFVTAALVAALFWHYCGRSLQYDVYANEVLWYSEDFSQGFRMGLTIFIALIVAGIVAALPAWLVYAWCHDYHRGNKPVRPKGAAD